jgi:hypothetical protein
VHQEGGRILDYLFCRAFAKSAALVNTFYNGRRERIWVYSERYVRSLLSAAGFIVLEDYQIHLLSPLLYLVSRNVAISARAARLDRLLRGFRAARAVASNIILLCELCERRAGGVD